MTSAAVVHRSRGFLLCFAGQAISLLFLEALAFKLCSHAVGASPMRRRPRTFPGVDLIWGRSIHSAAVVRHRFAMVETAGAFFHVDRHARLAAGQTITLRPAAVTGGRERAIIHDLLPDGVSEWGQGMLDDDPPLIATVEGLRNHHMVTPLQVNGEWGSFLGQDAQRALRAGRTRLVEAMAEVVRHGTAPEKPSRLACVYAYRTLAEAEAFRMEEDVPAAPIWRVMPGPNANVHEGDSRLLAIPETMAQFIARTIVYWHGDRLPNSTTTVELLLPPPVQVLGRAL